MSHQWVIYALIFAAVFLAVQGVRGLLIGRVHRRQIEGRFASVRMDRTEQDVALLKARNARVAPFMRPAQRWIIQSGTNLTFFQLFTIGAALSLLIYVAVSRIGPPGAPALSAALGGGVIFAYLKRKRARRIARFGEQLPDVLDIIVRSLKAGHPVAVSFSLVGREMPAPAGPELTLVFEELTYGRDIREALESLKDRVGHPDIAFMITSISIAHQTGGNLGVILARLSKLIRERFRMKRKIKALSAEGRFGGYILTAVPLLVFGLVSLLNPGYYGEFWGHPIQNTMFGLALVLLIIGNVVIFKMVNFKV